MLGLGRLFRDFNHFAAHIGAAIWADDMRRHRRATCRTILQLLRLLGVVRSAAARASVRLPAFGNGHGFHSRSGRFGPTSIKETVCKQLRTQHRKAVWQKCQWAKSAEKMHARIGATAPRALAGGRSQRDQDSPSIQRRAVAHHSFGGRETPQSHSATVGRREYRKRRQPNSLDSGRPARGDRQTQRSSQPPELEHGMTSSSQTVHVRAISNIECQNRKIQRRFVRQRSAPRQPSDKCAAICHRSTRTGQRCFAGVLKQKRQIPTSERLLKLRPGFGNGPQAFLTERVDRRIHATLVEPGRRRGVRDQRADKFRLSQCQTLARTNGRRHLTPR